MGIAGGLARDRAQAESLRRIVGRGLQSSVIEGETFDSLEAAEWAVFKRRWEALTGNAIDDDGNAS